MPIKWDRLFFAWGSVVFVLTQISMDLKFKCNWRVRQLEPTWENQNWLWWPLPTIVFICLWNGLQIHFICDWLVFNAHFSSISAKLWHHFICICSLLHLDMKWPSWLWSYGSWIYNYLCNQCLSVSPLMLWVRISIRARCTTLCDKVCQWLATGRKFSSGTPVFSTNKTNRQDITEILL